METDQNAERLGLLVDLLVADVGAAEATIALLNAGLTEYGAGLGGWGTHSFSPPFRFPRTKIGRPIPIFVREFHDWLCRYPGPVSDAISFDRTVFWNQTRGIRVNGIWYLSWKGEEFAFTFKDEAVMAARTPRRLDVDLSGLDVASQDSYSTMQAVIDTGVPKVRIVQHDPGHTPWGGARWWNQQSPDGQSLEILCSPARFQQKEHNQILDCPTPEQFLRATFDSERNRVRLVDQAMHPGDILELVMQSAAYETTARVEIDADPAVNTYAPCGIHRILAAAEPRPYKIHLTGEYMAKEYEATTGSPCPPGTFAGTPCLHARKGILTYMGQTATLGRDYDGESIVKAFGAFDFGIERIPTFPELLSATSYSQRFLY